MSLARPKALLARKKSDTARHGMAGTFDTSRCCHADTDYIQTMMIGIGVEMSAFCEREKREVIPFDRTKCVDLFEKVHLNSTI